MWRWRSAVLLCMAACGGGAGAQAQPDAAARPDAGAQADAPAPQPDAAPPQPDAPPPCFDPPSGPTTGVRIGAIRWDAWFAEPEEPPLINRVALWAHQWFERVPFD